MRNFHFWMQYYFNLQVNTTQSQTMRETNTPKLKIEVIVMPAGGAHRYGLCKLQCNSIVMGTVDIEAFV